MEAPIFRRVGFFRVQMEMTHCSRISLTTTLKSVQVKVHERHRTRYKLEVA